MKNLNLDWLENKMILIWYGIKAINMPHDNTIALKMLFYLFIFNLKNCILTTSNSLVFFGAAVWIQHRLWR